jgi:hypothetical protein
MRFFPTQQAIVRAASAAQQGINRFLHQPYAASVFGSPVAAVHNRLHGAHVRPIPHLLDELGATLGIAAAGDATRIDVADAEDAAHP